MARRTLKDQQKIFLLDTSVILYDHSAIRNFEEHDVAIPIQVLEEIDHFKKGNDTRNFEARGFIRFIDQISENQLISDWISLNGSGKGKFKVVMAHQNPKIDAVAIFGDEKYDHQILNAALSLKEAYPKKKVVLVSKDICLRLKAKSLDLYAEDYETGKIKDVQQLYTGRTEVKDTPIKLFNALFGKGYANAVLLKNIPIFANHYYLLSARKKTLNAFYHPPTDQLLRVDKQEAFGIKPRNVEQQCALHALLNKDIKLVTLQGMSGTGKTLLALSAALQQRRDFRQIFVARPVIPLGNKDIGYLPGDIKSKLDPYMQPIWDNLKIIKEQFGKDEKNHKRIDQMVESEKITIAPLAYMRGRTLTKIFLIVDESQNLTPHEVRTIISRAGEQTKVVFTGDIHQIDTPYLDSESNGLSYLIDKAKDHPLFAHITLEKGQRSDLANFANEVL